jgi:hypothetical protein
MRAARLAIIAVLLTGCASVAPVATTPAGTPVVIYVTPAPLAVTPAPSPAPTPTQVPTPSPRPTKPPRPTLTADDVKIQGIIKDGAAQMLDILDEMSAPDSDVVVVFRELRDFASSQQTRLSIYSPSSCTTSAAGLWRTAMEDAEGLAQGFLDWVADGAKGDAPGDPGAVGGEARSALDAANAACS